MRTLVLLCIDDRPQLLQLRKDSFEPLGYFVITVTSALPAIAVLENTAVDAVVLDYEMPEMCGDVVASRMKQLKPDIPIMLLTGHDSLSDEMLDQVDIFFSKKEPPWTFVAAVQVLLTSDELFFSKWLRVWRHKAAA